MTATHSGQCPILTDNQTIVIITKENIASLLPSTYDTKNGTVVTLQCLISTYKICGSSMVTCLSGTWQPAPPVCVPKEKSGTPCPNNATTTPGSVNDLNTTQPTLIITSTICAAIVVFLLVLLLYKMCVRRCRSSNKDFHERTSTSPLPLYTRSTGSTVLQSSWPDATRTWTYLSVDRLLRDIERSRKENPDHSWREFASISTYSTIR